MPKIKVIDPNGVHFSGKILPAGSEHTIEKGPHLAAWTRFKQVQVLDEEQAAPAAAGPAAPALVPEKAPPPPAAPEVPPAAAASNAAPAPKKK